MAQKILIDLTKYRDCKADGSCENTPAEAIYSSFPNTIGLKTIRELAVFRFTCRKCTEAPCVASCPAEALEKDEAGMIIRHTNLCIACKSCVVICPFGTMMTDFFEHHKSYDKYFNIQDEKELQKLIKASPEGAVRMVDMEEDPENHIYQLNEKVLIKEYSWDSLNK